MFLTESSLKKKRDSRRRKKTSCHTSQISVNSRPQNLSGDRKDNKALCNVGCPNSSCSSGDYDLFEICDSSCGNVIYDVTWWRRRGTQEACIALHYVFYHLNVEWIIWESFFWGVGLGLLFFYFFQKLSFMNFTVKEKLAYCIHCSKNYTGVENSVFYGETMGYRGLVSESIWRIRPWSILQGCQFIPQIQLRLNRELPQFHKSHSLGLLIFSIV